MSADAGGLAVWDRAIERNLQRGAAKGSPSDKELRAALATAAELIAAGREYREAIAARESDDYGAKKVYNRADAAQTRFDAALAAADPQGEK